jgi:hypothetical protein
MSQSTIQQSSVRNGLLAALAPEDWAHLGPHLEAVELPFDQTRGGRACRCRVLHRDWHGIHHRDP